LTQFNSILLGDNPFFGVDHLSHERARLRSLKNNSFENAVNVIRYSYENGVKDMMINTHPNIDEFFMELKNEDLLDKINFHPMIPYAAGYVQKLTEKGSIGVLKDILSSTGIKNEIKIISKSGLGFLKKDLGELFKVFLDVELLRLEKINMKVVYLHPAITDLALSLNLKNIFEIFFDHLQKNHNVQAGLCTKNFPRLIDKLDEWDLECPHIMTSFNKSGFLMNPSRQECETYLEKYSGKLVAMNILAGGFLDVNTSIEYIKSLKNIDSVIVGVSSIKHAQETFSLLKS
jgi:hypothetical protein